MAIGEKAKRFFMLRDHMTADQVRILKLLVQVFAEDSVPAIADLLKVSEDDVEKDIEYLLEWSKI